VFCGYSDITALQNAMLALADLVTYSGPHWSSFGMRDHFEFTLDRFVDCLFRDVPFELVAARSWTDDAWFVDQDNRTPVESEGWWILGPGKASGQVVGGNLGTLNLLHGTPYLRRWSIRYCLSRTISSRSRSISTATSIRFSNNPGQTRSRRFWWVDSRGGAT
jgi:muramoyltetrapeptide carboxypeptidase LdcA involved in peptidoglycan recycling